MLQSEQGQKCMFCTRVAIKHTDRCPLAKFPRAAQSGHPSDSGHHTAPWNTLLMFKRFGEVCNITFMTVQSSNSPLFFYSKDSFLHLNQENTTKVAVANVILRHIFSVFFKHRISPWYSWWCSQEIIPPEEMVSEQKVKWSTWLLC